MHVALTADSADFQRSEAWEVQSSGVLVAAWRRMLSHPELRIEL
jgi:hypothetical protein